MSSILFSTHVIDNIVVLFHAPTPHLLVMFKQTSRVKSLSIEEVTKWSPSWLVLSLLFLFTEMKEWGTQMEPTT